MSKDFIVTCRDGHAYLGPMEHEAAIRGAHVMNLIGPCDYIVVESVEHAIAREQDDETIRNMAEQF